LVEEGKREFEPDLCLIINSLKTFFLINLQTLLNPLYMKVQILIPFFIYIILLIIFSIFTARKDFEGMTDFFLGERKINRFVVAISTALSARGAWLILGVSTQAYIMGLSSIWMVVGFIISEFLLFLFLAPVIRKYSEEHSCLTITDLFTSRFKDSNNYLRIIVSILLIFFSLIFISSQFKGGSIAFYALLGISNIYGIIITGVIILLFILFGGYKTLVITDVFHSIIILSMLLCLPVIVLIRLKGFGNLQAEIFDISPDFFNFKTLSAGTLYGFLSLGLASTGNPNILTKYMSIHGSRHFTGIAIVNTIMNILMVTGAICIGMFARVYFPSSDSIPGADSQNVYIGLAGAILHPLLLGVVFISIFAAVLSAAGSQILVSASTVIIDIYEKTLNKGKGISQSKLIFLSRIAIVVLIYIAILLGMLIEMDFYQLFLFTSAGLGAALGPALILSFQWKGTTGLGIRAGAIIGALTVIIWKSLPVLSDKVYELIPGFIFATIAVWLGSRIDKSMFTYKFNQKERYEDIKKASPFE
jgi:sodium/proline symporter